MLISLRNNVETSARSLVPWLKTTTMDGRWERRSFCTLRGSARFRGCPSFWNTFRASACWVFSSADYVKHRPSVTWPVIHSNPFLPLVSGQNPPAAGWPGVWERAASEGEFSFERVSFELSSFEISHQIVYKSKGQTSIDSLIVNRLFYVLIECVVSLFTDKYRLSRLFLFFFFISFDREFLACE